MTVDEIRKDFGIKSNDITEIRRELRDIIKEIHPDKNEGKFKSKLDELNYHKILAAIEFLDQDFSLVSRTEISSLATLIRDALPAKKEEVKVKTLEDRGNVLMKSYKDATIFPKVSSTLITAILSFLWLFPSTIADHPILSKYLTTDNPVFAIVWGYSIILSGMYWVTAKSREERIDSAIKRLNLESVQNRLFESFVSLETYSKKKSKVFRFTKEDFIDHLTDIDMISLDYRPKRLRSSVIDVLPFFPFRRRNINLELSQALADLIVERALDRGLVSIEKGKRLSDSYLYEIEEENTSPRK